MTDTHTIDTVMHTYRFRQGDGTDADEYAVLSARLRAMGLQRLVFNGDKGQDIEGADGATIQLEIAHLFENQWNTGPTPFGYDGKPSESGLRVFDWVEDSWPNRSIKSGHWLEQTDEMREIRRNTHACGYCGKQEPAAKGHVFCPHCLDSEYLKANELHLTRMRAVATSFTTPREKLTEAERTHLLPLYTEAQIHGTTERGTRRIKAERTRIAEKCDDTTKHAIIERDGLLWLLNRGYRTANVLYYTHTGVFCFGWRSPLDPTVASEVLDWISEFPYPYTIKATDREYQAAS